MKLTSSLPSPELDVMLKNEAMRRKKPTAELLREALRSYVEKQPRQAPPGAGAFQSGHRDTAERSEELLAELGFGEDPG